MRGAGAAKRREQEPSPDKASIEADLMRVIAGSADVAARLGRHDSAVAGIIAKLERLAAECPNAEHLAVLADRLRARHEQVAIEAMGLAAHNAEARAAAEQLVSVLGANAMMRDAWIAEGRRREAAERDAQPRPPRARHAHRKRYLKPVPGIPTAVTRAAAAGIVAAGLTGTIAAVHEESSVRTVASAPSPARGVHRMPPDTAVLVPSSSPRPVASPRPSMAAASARPAPAATPSPSRTPSPSAVTPSPSASTPADPVLDVPRLLDLGASILGELTFSAEGQAVTWTARATDGITLSQSAGVAVQGQPVTIEVTDPTGDGGWVYISFGGTTIPVQVTSSLGIPALGL